MQQRTLGLILLGALALTACGQTSAPGGTSTEPSASLGTQMIVPGDEPDTVLSPRDRAFLESEIVDMQQLEAEVAAGVSPAPTDEMGQPVPLNDLIGSFQADLQEGQQALSGLGSSLAAAAPYAQNVYLSIMRDTYFESNLATNKRRYPRFNWTTDGCSSIAQYSYWANTFYMPCVQHDFGYRNVKFYPGLMNESHRAVVDAQFKAQMRRKCAARRWDKYTCYWTADDFYIAVHRFAQDAFYH